MPPRSLPSLAPLAGVTLPVPPWRLSGAVYGVLLNHTAELAALGPAAHQPPHKAPPQAPVLQVRPRNSLALAGACVTVPADAPALEASVQLGLVLGRTACRVSEAEALAHLAGVLPVLDVRVPHESHYRPAVRQRGRDGFCVLGPQLVPLAALGAPEALDALPTHLHIDGQPAQASTTAERLRGAARLLADVSAFMTLHPGDVLLLGASHGAPLVCAGQSVAVQIEGVGGFSTLFEAEAPATAAVAAPGTAPVAAGTGTGAPTWPARRCARVAVGGAIHTAYPHPQGVQLADGRVLAEDAVVWLPPFEVGTVIALGLNYADHVKELSKELTLTAKDEPLVFLKSASACIGHRGHTPRPRSAAFMHYECELAVVMGAPARNVKAADALAHVAGYTVCNDYAVRDYLENWYRPNLRVKHRDGGTVLGPWFVPAAEVPDPQALTLRTRVNGQITQQGSTGHMVNSVAELIEYLSSFMTLLPGDVILTGTPEGVANVQPGDEVLTEIDGIGALLSTLVADDLFER